MKVLIISTYYHPWQTVGGIRAALLAKHLSKSGHEVAVLTLDERVLPRKDHSFVRKGVKVREIRIAPTWVTPYKLRTKSGKEVGFWRKALRKITTYWTPDSYYYWALKAANHYIDSTQFNPDVVFSSALPFSNHHAGMRIAGHFHSFWVADFRDLWIGNHYESPAVQARKQKYLQHQNRTLASANVVTCISDEMAQSLKQTLYAPERVKVLPNAFDDEEIACRVNPAVRNEKLTLLYTGRLYEGYRDLSCLFAVLCELSKHGKNIKDFVKIQYAGPDGSLLCHQAANYQMESVVEDLGFILREEALRCQRSADVLLLSSGNGSESDAMVVTGKVFEYLAARRPILAIGYEHGDLGNLLRKTKAGEIFSPADLPGIQKEIQTWFTEWHDSGYVDYAGDVDTVMSHSWSNRVRSFVSMIEEYKGK